MPSSIFKMPNKLIRRLIHAAYFSNEIAVLKAPPTLEKFSCLTMLDPLLDTRGLLRIGGRLQECTTLSHDKHPIILPKSAHMTATN